MKTAGSLLGVFGSLCRVAILTVISAGLFALNAPPARADSEECLECHADRDSLEPVTPGRVVESLLMNKEALVGSVHEELDCSDCHAMSAKEEDVPHYEEGGAAPKLGCGDCHEQAMNDYLNTDIHGKRWAAKDPHAPWCSDCHGGHRIVPLESEESPLSHLNQPGLCGKCHGTDELTNAEWITKRQLVARYKTSVHWLNVQQGKPAATCADCHGNHTVLPSSDTGSRVTRLNLLTTCAKCHPRQVHDYADGSHGRTLLHGNLDVPTCTTCHGDHDILSLKIQPGGTRDFAATKVCMWCHGNERMMARYALDTSPVDSYMRDFHGKAQRGSAGIVATCADCHDAHRSLPQSHPQSRMHLSNRGAACGKCHGTNTDTFAMSFTHKRRTEEPGSQVKHWVAIIYVLLIVVTIGGMLVHNFVIWLFFARKKTRYQRKHGRVERLSSAEKIWHWAMLISFAILTVTGFALSFSESVLFRWIYDFGFSEKARAWLHRAFAIVMIIDMIYFMAYTVFTRRGRRMWWIHMFPRWRDVREFFATMGYYLFIRKEKPRYGVFNYAEKAEYWALLWGTAVMVLSGFVLWFSNYLPPDSPPWVYAVAQLVHFYEAVLAGLSIVVWHLFHTVFHPEEYPLGTSFLTGKLTDHEAEERFTDEAIRAQLPEARVGSDAPPATHKWME